MTRIPDHVDGLAVPECPPGHQHAFYLAERIIPMPPADKRNSWQCPHCLEWFHILKGHNPATDHYPYCPAIAADPSIMDHYTRPEDGELCAVTRS